jgi:ribonuclease HI
LNFECPATSSGAPSTQCRSIRDFLEAKENIMPTLEDLKDFLTQRGVSFSEVSIQHGVQLNCRTGEIFCHYPKRGRVVVQGTRTELGNEVRAWAQGEPTDSPATRLAYGSASAAVPDGATRLVAATDGSCIGNGRGPGGWAWITEDGRQSSAGALNTTNNRMELRAVLELLTATNHCEPLVIQTDSAYVIGIFTQWLEGWRSRGLRTASGELPDNLELIEAIDGLLRDRIVTFEKVPGHAGHPLNERADALALAAARRAEAELTRRESAEDL